jgi:hypothetical protein
MVSALTDDIKIRKTDDISRIDTKLYKLKALINKLRNCLTPAFDNGIELLMPEGTSNKNGVHIYFITSISRTSPDKKTQTHYSGLHHGTKNSKIQLNGLISTRHYSSPKIV